MACSCTRKEEATPSTLTRTRSAEPKRVCARARGLGKKAARSFFWGVSAAFGGTAHQLYHALEGFCPAQLQQMAAVKRMKRRAQVDG